MNAVEQVKEFAVAAEKLRVELVERENSEGRSGPRARRLHIARRELDAVLLRISGL